MPVRKKPVGRARLLSCIEIINVDCDLLLKAIEAGDPKRELILRVKDIKKLIATHTVP